MSKEITVEIQHSRTYSSSANMETFKYDNVTGKPKINGVELVGDKTSAELGLGGGADAYDDTELRTKIDEVEDVANDAKAIAEGKATGYVFDTVDDMNTWLEANSGILKLGDNLYIRAVDVPDYWWDGENAQQLETQKVDLTDYVKNTDYATANQYGVVKVSGQYGVGHNTSVGLFVPPCTTSQIDNRGISTSNKPLTLDKLDYAVKTSVTTNTITLTDDEKTAARTWLGAVGTTDYASQLKAGLIKALGSYNLTVTSTDGTLLCNEVDSVQYSTSSKYGFVSKGTLENIKYDLVKRAVTTNNITLTDEEKAAAQAWLGIESSGGGASLPDQDGNAGKFLTTNGEELSWSDKPLVNKSNSAGSLVVGENAGSFANFSTAIGANSYVETLGAAWGGLALGYGAQTYKGAIMINGSGSVCRNYEVGTVKVATNGGMYTLLNADSTIPLERLKLVTDQIGDISTALTAILGE